MSKGFKATESNHSFFANGAGIESLPSPLPNSIHDVRTRGHEPLYQREATNYNHLQDDWAKWVPMVEFSDNNNVASATQMSPFYMNKGFHPRMSFAPDTTNYETTRERLQSRTAADIAVRMEEIANFGRAAIAASQARMELQANKHRQESLFKEGDLVM